MKCLLFLLALSISTEALSQQVTTHLPKKISRKDKFVFYLHGGIVQDQGPNAVSTDYGPYLYYAILDTFRTHGFHVVSEVRPKETDVAVYGKKVAGQIDSLLHHRVPPKNITVVGASLGAYITLEAAHVLGNSRVNFVVMALCNEYNLGFYEKYRKTLCGNFLSIYEASDQKLSCDKLLLDPTCKSGYREIRLNMGNGHGFIFKPYGEWVGPLVKWMKAAN